MTSLAASRRVFAALLRPTGKSLLPLMEVDVRHVRGPDEAIGFEGSGGEAIFMGDYKLMRNGAPFGDGTWRLMNLRDDPTESKDLSALQPERLKKMLAEVEAFHQRVGVVLPEAGYNPLRQLLVKHWPVLVRQLRFVRLPAVLLLDGVAAAGVVAAAPASRRHGSRRPCGRSGSRPRATRGARHFNRCRRPDTMGH
jgi:hypothetical protein